MERMMPEKLSFWSQCAAVLLLLVVVNGVIYYPARYHLFGGDQIHYMAELKGERSLLAGIKQLDYARDRTYWKGDESLYRPLLMGWLAVLNSILGYQYLLWNLVQVMLHILLCFCLFLLFRQTAPFGFSLLFCVAFSTSRHLFELNSEPHLGGYLLSFIFFILILSQIFKIERRGGVWTYQQVWGMTALVSVCIFSFEIFIPLILFLMLGAVLSRKVEGKPGFRRGQVAIVAVPFVLFTVLYLYHGATAPQFFFVNSIDHKNLWLRIQDIGAVFESSWRTLGHWSGYLFSPAAKGNSFYFAWSFFLGISLLTLKNFKRWRRVLFFAFLIVIYLGLLSLGRPTPSTHHYYFFFLMVWLIFFHAADFNQYPRTLVVLLLGLTVSGMMSTWEMSTKLEPSGRASYAYFSELHRFVEQHKTEPEFSFSIETSPPDLDPPIFLKEGYPNQALAPGYRRSTFQILFARYYDESNPLYELHWEGQAFKIKENSADAAMEEPS